MKKVFTLIIVIIGATQLFAQDTLYYDTFDTHDTTFTDGFACGVLNGAYAKSPGTGSLVFDVNCHDEFVFQKLMFNDGSEAFTIPTIAGKTSVTMEVQVNGLFGDDTVSVFPTIFDEGGTYPANETTPSFRVVNGEVATLTFSPTNLTGFCPNGVMDSMAVAGVGFILNGGWVNGGMTGDGWSFNACFTGQLEVLSVLVTGEQAVGVGFDELEVANDLISIFPNPARDIITVEVSELSGAQEVQLLDMMGTTLATQNMVGTSTFSLEGLAKGTYMVQMIGEGRVARKRVTVQ